MMCKQQLFLLVVILLLGALLVHGKKRRSSKQKRFTKSKTLSNENDEKNYAETEAQDMTYAEIEQWRLAHEEKGTTFKYL